MRTFLRLGLAAAFSLCLIGTTGATSQPFSQQPFVDVKTSSHAYPAIEYFRQQNLIKGYADGTFKPNQEINRAEFAFFITNPFFLNGNFTNNCVLDHQTDKIHLFFFDVQKESWYADAVCAAKMKGLLEGYADGSFRPGNPINFAEAAKIVVNTFVSSFANPDTTSPNWYKPYIQKLTELKAVPATIKSPAHLMTRSEMVELIYNVKLKNGMKTTSSAGDVR